MSLMFDEYGRPVIVVKEQQAKGRLKGLAAQKSNISAARNVANVLKTSLGPKGSWGYTLALHRFGNFIQFQPKLTTKNNVQVWIRCS